MIRTLLVDDEPIVRAGLLHILPWERHGMQVIADVGGGEQALRVLERERVDLLVTDLSMPGMSGFELIEQVQQSYSGINIAILTCHQDFQYIQEALRRGVLDYIVKTELDEDKLDELFQRMAFRLADKEVKPVESSKVTPGSREIVLFIGLDPTCTSNELYKIPLVADNFVIPVGEGSWMIDATPLPADWDEEVQQQLQRDTEGHRWVVMRIHHATMRNQLKELAVRYMRRHAFYVADWFAGSTVIHDSMRNIKAFEDSAEEPDWMKHWLALDWVVDQRAWEELLYRIQEQRPEPGRLCREMADTVRAWQLMRKNDKMAELLKQLPHLRIWTQWKSWLAECRGLLLVELDAEETGKDLAICILKAIRIGQERLEDNLTQKELASLVHLSRGYFSECFKRVVGSTFNDYMRGLRVDTAKRLLSTTEFDVSEIAKRCGFVDETYFRKLFREETGMSVRECRELSNREGYILAYFGADERQMSELAGKM